MHTQALLARGRVYEEELFDVESAIEYYALAGSDRFLTSKSDAEVRVRVHNLGFRVEG